jgi:hypothetical protein
MHDHEVIEAVCLRLLDRDTDSAASLIERHLPHDPDARLPKAPGVPASSPSVPKKARAKRTFTSRIAIGLFLRDGYVDRYNGERLVFPGTLKVLSEIMPEVFPAHPNWKLTESHIGFWTLFPTIDHVVPVARGGDDDADNWATTSMATNMQKSSSTLEELGWQLHPGGDCEQWDGLTGRFFELADLYPQAVSTKYIQNWATGARAALDERGTSS